VFLRRSSNHGHTKDSRPPDPAQPAARPTRCRAARRVGRPGRCPLSATFAALADPARRAILARLADGEATVNELAEPFTVSLQAISKHLKVLEHAGLITRGRRAQLRP
jgi:DNA-binding HxlR family transcriptional regulator